jgi:ribosomal-protein-alanine N-acetyltransferase
MNSDSEIQTERLILRELRRSDLSALAKMNADPRVMEHFPGSLSREDSDAFAGRIRAHWNQCGFGSWAVERLEDGVFLGIVGLSHPRFEAHFTPCVEIGWRLAAAYWGKGYATEAAKAAVRLGFERLGLDQIVAFTVPQNQRSRRVMEKLGMTRSEADDFDHPNVPARHPLRRHVLYRIQQGAWAESSSRSGRSR